MPPWGADVRKVSLYLTVFFVVESLYHFVDGDEHPPFLLKHFIFSWKRDWVVLAILRAKIVDLTSPKRRQKMTTLNLRSIWCVLRQNPGTSRFRVDQSRNASQSCIQGEVVCRVVPCGTRRGPSFELCNIHDAVDVWDRGEPFAVAGLIWVCKGI